MDIIRKKWHWLFLGISILLYLASLMLPALLFEERTPLYGRNVLATGWLGVLTFNLAWYANPLYIVSIVAYYKEKYDQTIGCSGIALFLGLFSFGATKWWFDEGHATPITGLGIAFYVWMASFIVIFVAGTANTILKKITNNDSNN